MTSEQFSPSENQFDFVEMPDGSNRTDYPKELGLGNERFFITPVAPEVLRSLGGNAMIEQGE